MLFHSHTMTALYGPVVQPKGKESLLPEPFPWYIEWVLVALVCAALLIAIVILYAIKIYFLGLRALNTFRRACEYVWYEVICM